ncbi:serpin family protein, partial [Nocardioides sp.]|uniref:serpin family protein n=1 Tax=Nocardioides sp. TaxID=35761 RepID=UPI0027334A4C
LTRLVLVNALYLKAPWEEPFEESETGPRPFHLLDGSTVDVDTMTGQLALSRHGTGEGWEAVQLPYAGGELAMTVILPDEGRLADVEARVAAGELDQLLASLGPTMVDLTLPRWTFRSTSPLKDTLATVGMPTAFTDDADFLGMTSPETPSPERDLLIKDVLHETFIAVDEEGTEAAAATAVVMGLTSAPTYEPVVVDRSFLFVIHDVEHGTPLFLGRVTDPSQD